MDKQNHKISSIKPASVYHAVLLASHKQAKKTNGSKLKDLFLRKNKRMLKLYL